MVKHSEKLPRRIFALGQLREGHLYLLYSPRIYRSERLLSLAWQAATVYGYLQLGLGRVQTAIGADDLKESRILTDLG